MFGLKKKKSGPKEREFEGDYKGNEQWIQYSR